MCANLELLDEHAEITEVVWCRIDEAMRMPDDVIVVVHQGKSKERGPEIALRHMERTRGLADRVSRYWLSRHGPVSHLGRYLAEIRGSSDD